MREINFIQAINEALAEELRLDPKTFMIGLDIWVGAFGATSGLTDEFGKERILNAPISEAGYAGAGVGAAMAGMRPIVEIEFASFFYCCWDQVCNQAAKLRYMSGGQADVPITFRSVCGAIGSAAAQHSETVYSQFMSVPGLKIVVPSGPRDMKGLLKSAIRDNNPVLVFEHLKLGRTKEEVPDEDSVIPLGQAAVKREGTDVTIVAIGFMVSQALKAATSLEQDGISAEVVDPRTLIPLDEETILASVTKTHKVLVVDEAHLRCGAAAEIAAVIADKGFDNLDAPIKRLTTPDVPVPFSPPLEKFVLPDDKKICSAVKELLG
jgi:pyruvate/2-oxoglutarate/acetoin dehydrogenase E1 component